MLELTMASVAEAEEGATAGMLMADAPSEPGAVLCVGRDRNVCRLAPPDGWLFVSRVHLEFRCGPDGLWTVTWLHGSQAEPSSDVQVVADGAAQAMPYGGYWRIPAGGSGEVVIHDRLAARSVNVGFYHEP
ncbi:hypothetical protein GCM10018793_48800 [Streptomyces sulfonofaciens]|uniref:FHA domain-containing protein n=1 Tax=Streptomyces sulfonofaciens TaxID=68272 RepID=A0A919GI54_9ACTN|nr:hypothetical protein [Streptomyces sulfonofaciens]GHH84435.1 hypothetical protein GCM10018793_48800 [Streptomyces sulfonofaciens]